MDVVVSSPAREAESSEGALEKFVWDPHAPRPDVRHDWVLSEIVALYDRPFHDLLFQAQAMHRKYFDPGKIQLSTLLNIKQGGCAEDCKYCAQSARYSTGLKASKLMDIDSVLAAARQAKANGAGRFCMGAAWRDVKDRDLGKIAQIVTAVKATGLETCMTLGMLNLDQAKQLKDAGLDYYNHNIDTSPDYYKEVITTRSFEDRLDTLSHVRAAGLNVCSGGIVGMGEARRDRAAMVQSLANLPTHPGSVPINMLVPVKGTPFADQEPLDSFEMVRTIAVTRLVMPKAYVRLSAGRRSLGDEGQALCFLAGANSIFYGDKLLTTANPEENDDLRLFARLDLVAEHKGVRAEDEDINPPCTCAL